VPVVRRIWKLWCMSLGEKASDNTREADIVALLRTTIVLVNFITCFFIMAGVVAHWPL